MAREVFALICIFVTLTTWFITRLLIKHKEIKSLKTEIKDLKERLETPFKLPQLVCRSEPFVSLHCEKLYRYAEFERFGTEFLFESFVDIAKKEFSKNIIQLMAIEMSEDYMSGGYIVRGTIRAVKPKSIEETEWYQRTQEMRRPKEEKI